MEAYFIFFILIVTLIYAYMNEILISYFIYLFFISLSKSPHIKSFYLIIILMTLEIFPKITLLDFMNLININLDTFFIFNNILESNISPLKYIFLYLLFITDYSKKYNVPTFYLLALKGQYLKIKKLLKELKSI